ncbi:MAG: diacylglycerol kinase [Proteobacteria bacterium]|nr:MAG: diacylglycerol kinase [Pseudomonadota bacterium]
MKNRGFPQRFACALRGIGEGLRSERSLRTQSVAVTAVVAILAFRRAPPVWWALASLACGGVLAAELMNTAIEKLADHLHPERHAAVRILKDCAAGAVLVACLAALGVAVAYVRTL